MYVVIYHENIMHYKMNFLPSTETMINKIKEIYAKYDYKFYDIKNNDDLMIIYNLFIHDIVPRDDNKISDDIIYSYGVYYRIQENYGKMKKYYLMGIERGCIKSMNALADYYGNIEHNYKRMRKYYLMAIKEGDDADAMNNMGSYYHSAKRRCSRSDVISTCYRAKKYYRMAINKGHVDAMYNLGLYYDNIEHNYDMMEKYFLMAVEYGNIEAMYALGHYYRDKHNNELMKKYLLMAIDNGRTDAMYELGCYYRDKGDDYELMKKYLLMAIDNGCVDAMYDLGCYYRYEGDDFELMKKYFLMAGEAGDDNSFIELVCYYNGVEDNFNLAKEYFLKVYENIDFNSDDMEEILCHDDEYDNLIKVYHLIAIEKGDIDAMYSMAKYHKREGEYGLMKYYFLMAIKKGDSRSMFAIGNYYAKLAKGEYYSKINEIELMKKYYLMAMDKGHATACDRLIDYCYNINNDEYVYGKVFTHMIKYNRYNGFKKHLMIKFYDHSFTNHELNIIANKAPEELAISPEIIKVLNKMLNTNIDIMKLHFDYSMEGKGFKEAKADFIDNISKHTQ